MIKTIKELIARQLEAALCTLDNCIERCPDARWHAPVANLAFCQAAFHALFYVDYYLERDEGAFREQPYHHEHASLFRDYEELLEDRPQRLLYDKAAVRNYLQHCRRKAADALAAESMESLTAPCGFPRRDGMSRAELYVYILRHVQHHAAQLSLRLRLDALADVPWVVAGWQEFD